MLFIYLKWGSVITMKFKKSIAIGIIALFIGSALLPMSGTAEARHVRPITIALMMMGADGFLKPKILTLTQGDLIKLIAFINSLKLLRESGLNIKDLFQGLSGSSLSEILNLQWLEKLPGKPIISCGEGRTYITPYHARIQMKKLIAMWNYPDGIGATIIWGNGLSSQPTQILLKRQFGLMVGFVGIYIYVPPLIEGMSSITCFIGSAKLAWGVAI